MKRSLFVILLVPALLLLSSCGMEKTEALPLARGAAGAALTVEVEGEVYGIELISSPTESRIAFMSPEPVAGEELIVREGKYYVAADGVEMELPPSMLACVKPIFDLTTIYEDGAKAEREGSTGEETYRIPHGGREYLVKLDPSGNLKEIVCRGEREIVMRDIEWKY